METLPIGPGVFEARYLAFLETITHLRPSLHRYCSRMTGSVLDGEDVVQEALFRAYRQLESLEEGRPLAPWLFRIAHNLSIDFLRRRKVRTTAEAEALEPDWVPAQEPAGPALGRAVEHLVLALPPKERACVLLKDVFDYTLEEIAELVDSTLGGVKAALHRGRAKLAELPVRAAPRPAADPGLSRLLQVYVERFNRRDWDGLRDLIRADARLLVADRYAGKISESPYFGRYESWTTPWRLAAGELDGELVAFFLAPAPDGAGWAPRAAIRLEGGDAGQGFAVRRIADYQHCPWLLDAAASVSLFEPPN